MAAMVAKNVAVHEPSKQTHAVLLYWRLPDEWADVLHSWISDPPIPSPLSGIPTPLLRQAIAVLTRSNRAQIISIADGEGVRFSVSTK
ncbi:hypothetical protein EV702DRAFT_1276851 [Suillus placidus]|uniref:Uncharacterized protein n=1 Tax=Suillus placidus TaxID=48579 RepID=A0A9P7D4G6_9AGAM|nr:hypothetical protein EV702DRAFT_1276851 [Suillus placidus]